MGMKVGEGEILSLVELGALGTDSSGGIDGGYRAVGIEASLVGEELAKSGMEIDLQFVLAVF